MKRREFLTGVAAAVSLARRGRAQGAAREAKLARIGVMSAGFARLIGSSWDQAAQPKSLDIMEIPEMLADRFGIHNFEVQTIHFLSMEPSYYARFNERLKRAKCKVSNICLELDDNDHRYSGLVGPSSPDPALRAKGIELTKRWVDIAATIGCPSVMANQGSSPITENLDTCVEALKAMAAYGKTKNVAVTLENRGKATPEQLVSLIRAAGIYANPDLGNFPDEETRARGMRLLIPLAHHQCHVKMNARFDFGNSIRLSGEIGFKGLYSIEGGGPDPNVNLPKLIDALIENI
jgi:sugar phosphate isomerase/epimerase